MHTSLLSSQGQVTVPASIRSLLGLKPGHALVWSVDTSTAVPSVTVTSATKTSVSLLKGSSQGVYGKTKKDIDSYVAEERSSWNE